MSELSSNQEKETPNDRWATWGLIKEARKFKLENYPPLIAWIIDRLEAYNIGGSHPGPCCFIVTAGGYWGRGATLLEAAQRCHKSGASKTYKAYATLIINDGTAEVNSCGYLLTDSVAVHKTLGIIGTIGSIINANKSD